MPFNLLIVDDEKLTRESLLEYVNWKQFDIKMIQTASNGMEALNFIRHMKPDILLCDVKMPRMNGIELASRVREIHPECKIIFLSGYSDKEYLLSAIVLKAEGYIEKPIDVGEIERVVSIVINQLRQERMEKANNQLLASRLVESSPIVKQEIALALINPSNDFNAFKNKFVPLYFSWPDTCCLSVICMRPNKNISYQSDSKPLIKTLYEFLESNDCPIPIDFFAGQIPSGEVALIVNNIDLSVLNALLLLLQNHLSTLHHLEMTMGISSVYSSLWEVAHAFEEACEATLQMFYLGHRQIISYAHYTTKKLIPTHLFTELKINLPNVENLFNMLKQEKYSDVNVVQHHLYHLYMTMLERTLNNNSMALENFKHLTLDQCKELICYGMQALKTLGDDIYDIKIKEAVHFILWNYDNLHLSIKMIADHVDLSQNYLCSLFKQNTHSTINDFIITIRIEKAKKLLKKTDLRLYEIATKVGLTDPNYLSYLFKKRCGYTPSQYRHSQK